MPKAVILSPLPFPTWEATTKICVYETKETEDDGPQEVLVYDQQAVYDQTSKQAFDSNSHLISLTGKLIIQGDVQMSEGKIKGYVKIGKDKRTIHKCSKPKAMGVVYSTEIDLL